MTRRRGSIGTSTRIVRRSELAGAPKKKRRRRYDKDPSYRALTRAEYYERQHRQPPT